MTSSTERELLDNAIRCLKEIRDGDGADSVWYEIKETIEEYDNLVHREEKDAKLLKSAVSVGERPLTVEETAKLLGANRVVKVKGPAGAIQEYMKSKDYIPMSFALVNFYGVDTCFAITPTSYWRSHGCLLDRNIRIPDDRFGEVAESYFEFSGNPEDGRKALLALGYTEDAALGKFATQEDDYDDDEDES